VFFVLVVAVSSVSSLLCYPLFKKEEMNDEEEMINQQQNF